MRYLFCLFCLTATSILTAQVKGNKKIVTKSYEVSGIRSLAVHLYADLVVDCNAPEGMTITADENILPLIGKSVDDGKLTLDQVKWIEASQPIKIRIGAPDLKQIEQSTHESTFVNNIDRPSFIAMALVGRLVLNGRTNHLSANAEVGHVDARALDATAVAVNLWSSGHIQLAAPTTISGTVENGTVTYQGNRTQFDIRTKKDGRITKEGDSNDLLKNPSARYIDIRIKNNSSTRLNAFVRGPKPNGGSFSYGFPLRPGQVKKERWTVGTKVFRTSKMGTRKMLVRIKDRDENQVVNLNPQ